MKVKAFIFLIGYYCHPNQSDNKMENYTHYAKQADVFKHLVLCEVLKNEKPGWYIETNSACAMYHLEHTPEQEHGIYYFLRKASMDEILKASCYYKLEREAQQNGCYYGSPALAMKIWGKKADRYYFFDIEKKSLENVGNFAEQAQVDDRIVIRNCDSLKGAMDLLPMLSTSCFLHIDPYEIDKKADNGPTYLDVFIEATRLGMQCLLWYGFMTGEDQLKMDKYIVSHLQASGVTNVVWAKMILKSIQKDTIVCNPGISGSGLLASNLSDKSNERLLELSRRLEVLYKEARYKDQDGSLYYEGVNLNDPVSYNSFIK